MSSSEAKLYLLTKHQQIKEQIESIEDNDPVISFAGIALEATEIGTESWQSDVHVKTMAVKRSLLDFSTQIEKALAKLGDGSYGKCEKCHDPIAPERLMAMPAASHCSACV